MKSFIGMMKLVETGGVRDCCWIVILTIPAWSILFGKGMEGSLGGPNLGERIPPRQFSATDHRHRSHCLHWKDTFGPTYSLVRALSTDPFYAKDPYLHPADGDNMLRLDSSRILNSARSLFDISKPERNRWYDYSEILQYLSRKIGDWTFPLQNFIASRFLYETIHLTGTQCQNCANDWVCRKFSLLFYYFLQCLGETT